MKLLLKNGEVRGITRRQKDNGDYTTYINLEDSEGVSVQFFVDNTCNISSFKKGDKINAILDYNTRYGSLKVISIEGVK